MKYPLTALFAILAVMGLLSLTFCNRAQAHSWYTGLHNATGASCCNDADCWQLDDSDVTEVTGGYAIKSLGIVVPFRAATGASPDGHFHICRWGSPIETKCFFPPTNSY